MIVKKEFLNKLKDFGLNSYEAKIWSALLSRGVSTAGELSDIAVVPRSRSYDVLESLERKGFIITKLGKPFKYLAVSPSEVIERVKKNIKDDADKNVKLIDDIKTTEFLKELNLLHSQGVETFDPTEMTGYIKTRESVYDHIEKMINNSNSSVIVAFSAEELSGKSNLIDALKKADERGVDVKLLVSGKEKSIEAFKNLELKNPIRLSLYCKNRFVIADDKELLILMQDETKIHAAYDTGIWLNSNLFINSLIDMFSHGWEKSERL